jgi:hypothetical protein
LVARITLTLSTVNTFVAQVIISFLRTGDKSIAKHIPKHCKTKNKKKQKTFQQALVLQELRKLSLQHKN